jgi:hypothetical protein
MSGPTYGAVNQMPCDKERRINVHFRIPYLTKWGQSIVVTGTGAFKSSRNRHTVALLVAWFARRLQRAMQQHKQQVPCAP